MAAESLSVAEAARRLISAVQYLEKSDGVKLTPYVKESIESLETSLYRAQPGVEFKVRNGAGEWTTVKGYVVEPFGIDKRGRGYAWTITHLKTGALVAYVSTLLKARELANKLIPMLHWEGIEALEDLSKQPKETIDAIRATIREY